MIHSRRFLEAQTSPSPATTGPAAAAAEAFEFEASHYFGPAFRLTMIALLTAVLLMVLLTLYATATADRTAGAVGRRRSLEPESTVGSQPAVVYGLPLTSYKAEVAKTNDCPICLNEFIEGENLKLIPYCGHMFHQMCLDTWLSTTLNCPVCRFRLYFNL